MGPVVQGSALHLGARAPVDGTLRLVGADHHPHGASNAHHPPLPSGVRGGTAPRQPRRTLSEAAAEDTLRAVLEGKARDGGAGRFSGSSR